MLFYMHYQIHQYAGTTELRATCIGFLLFSLLLSALLTIAKPVFGRPQALTVLDYTSKSYELLPENHRNDAMRQNRVEHVCHFLSLPLGY